MIIQATNLKRTYYSTVKEDGAKGTLNLLLRPQKKAYDALKSVSFSIEAGSFVGLIGSNGAGKTTLLKILSGLIAPTSGSAMVMGHDPFKRNLDFRKKVALVMGQKAQLWWDLPAKDAFDLIRAIYDIAKPDYLERLTLLSELLEVKDLLGTQIRRLSLGERMKMELIGAILHFPKVIFLDEPTIGLDILAAHKLREFLKTFNQKEKATIILTSHNMEDIEKLCSRVMILQRGELLFDGKPGGLAREDERRLRIRFASTVTGEEVSKKAQIPTESIEESLADPEGEKDQHTLYFRTKKDKIVQVLQTLLAQYQITDMGIEEPSLESVIQRIYVEERNQK